MGNFTAMADCELPGKRMQAHFQQFFGWIWKEFGWFIKENEDTKAMTMTARAMAGAACVDDCFSLRRE